jgi:tetratricopeptide (TPR) repeat protein
MAKVPADVFAEGSAAYGWVVAQEQPVGLFDERDFFLGELALVTSSAARYLGSFQECEKWLDRAEAAFRHTVNPSPLLANAAYARLALKHHQGRHDDVLDLLPWLETSFARLEMKLELAKARFLKAMSLKQLGRQKEALDVVTPLCAEPVVRHEAGLYAQILIATGELHAELGDFVRSIRAYQEAIPVVSEGGRSFVGAELKWGIGDAYRGSKNMLLASEAYQGALEDYRALQMDGKEAILRLVVGETLLQLGRAREAEWQVLAALPKIDQEKMVPEGFAAVALLRESVRLRSTDSKALGELREYLQAKN